MNGRPNAWHSATSRLILIYGALFTLWGSVLVGVSGSLFVEPPGDKLASGGARAIVAALSHHIGFDLAFEECIL